MVEALGAGSARGVDRVWDDYVRPVEELEACGAVDVLAHPDLAKVAGHRSQVLDEFYDRMAEAARSSGLAAELNSSGGRKPVPRLTRLPLFSPGSTT
jgi:histidinol-phosphatase (PHP family)